jgi:hypothetical protein
VPEWVPKLLTWFGACKVFGWKIFAWIPPLVEPRAENWVERRWPAEVWKEVQGRQYHFVAWIFDGIVIAFCLGFPAWLRKRSHRAEMSAGKSEPLKPSATK